MKKLLLGIILSGTLLALSGNLLAQSAEMGKVFNKYKSKKHFELAEYGTEKPVWLNLITSNASFIRIMTCDAKPKSGKYKRFNHDLGKSTESFRVIFEFSDKDHFMKVLSSEKDNEGCRNYVVINRLGESEKVIWLYGKTNLKKFVDYLKDSLL